MKVIYPKIFILKLALAFILALKSGTSSIAAQLPSNQWLNEARSMTMEELLELVKNDSITAQERALSYYLIANLQKDISVRAAHQYLLLAKFYKDGALENSQSLKLLEAELLLEIKQWQDANAILWELLNSKDLDKAIGVSAINALFKGLSLSGHSEQIVSIIGNWPFASVRYDDLDFDALNDVYNATLHTNQVDGIRLLEDIVGSHFYTEFGKRAFIKLADSYVNRYTLGDIDRIPRLEFLYKFSQFAHLDNGLKTWIVKRLELPVRTSEHEIRILTPLERANALLKMRLYGEVESHLANITWEHLELPDQRQYWEISFRMASRRHNFGTQMHALTRLQELGIAVRGKLPALLQQAGEYSSSFRLFSELSRSNKSEYFGFKAFWSLVLNRDYRAIISYFNQCQRQGSYACWTRADDDLAWFWFGRALYATNDKKNAFKVFEKLSTPSESNFYQTSIQILYGSEMRASGYAVVQNSEPSSISRPIASNGATFGIWSKETESKFQKRIHNFEFFPKIKSIFRDLLELRSDEPSLSRLLVVTESLGQYWASQKVSRLITNANRQSKLTQSSQRGNELVSSTAQLKYPRAFSSIVKSVTKAHNLDENLVYSVMRAESAYNPLAKSSVGAKGLLQLMPYTALKVAKEFKFDGFEFDRLSIPGTNIVLAIQYLKKLIDYYDSNIVVALAAYNAGPKIVNLWVDRCRNCEPLEFVESIPYKETRNYVKKIVTFHSIYTETYGGSPLDLAPLVKANTYNQGIY